MKTLTVRLPDAIAAEIEAEARRNKQSKSDVVRARLTSAKPPQNRSRLDAFSDLIGSVDGLPSDLSSNIDYYLKKTGYGGKRHR